MGLFSRRRESAKPGRFSFLSALFNQRPAVAPVAPKKVTAKKKYKLARRRKNKATRGVGNPTPLLAGHSMARPVKQWDYETPPINSPRLPRKIR